MIPYYETRGLEVLGDNELVKMRTLYCSLRVIPRVFGEVSEGQN